MDTKNINWFARISVIILSVWLIGLVMFSINNNKNLFNNETIVIICLIIILVLSEVFDNFSIGRLLSISRESKTTHEELKKEKDENEKLRNYITNLMAVMTNNIISTKNANNVTTNIKVVGAGKEEAEAKEKAEEELENVARDEEKKDTKEQNKVNEVKDRDQRLLFNSFTISKIEKLAIDKYINFLGIPNDNVKGKVRIAEAFTGIDPIINRSPVFDGYVDTPTSELFIEVKNINFASIIHYFDSLYFMISQVMYYRQAKKVDACVVLLLTVMPERFQRPDRRLQTTINRLLEVFQPAISNSLLRVKLIEITEDDLHSLTSAKID